MIRQAACIGAGVIGAGWAARFAFAGIDVVIHDPNPEAERLVGEVMANAERAYGQLTMAPLPTRGRLTFAASIEEAVAGADWVQESVPEEMTLKRDILGRIDATIPDAPIGSSTSGLLPSEMQAGLRQPDRLFVAHPYNPVYLLPLVELVGGRATDPEVLTAARESLTGIGMKPVIVAKEIDAFVGDRLLESLWREALWLIKDDVCDVETLDDVMRYSFALRWAQMGLFQTYRLAGGETGMSHFLKQFGPALHWPWSRLTDVPELDDELVDKIARQSDAQAGGRSVRELERIRDDNLVAIIQALKANDWGAGALLQAYEEKLWSKGAAGTQAAVDERQPLRLYETQVNPAWVDYNGHMTEFRYLQVFGDSTDAVLRYIGADHAYVETGFSYYTVETHIMHLDEVKVGTRLYSTSQLLDADEKRLKLFHRIHRADDDHVVASAEQMLLHVDMKANRSMPASGAVLENLQRLAAAQGKLDMPAAAGRYVGQRRG